MFNPATWRRSFNGLHPVWFKLLTTKRTSFLHFTGIAVINSYKHRNLKLRANAIWKTDKLYIYEPFTKLNTRNNDKENF